MAALTSSAIAPLRVRAAAPAAGRRKVCICCRVAGLPLARDADAHATLRPPPAQTVSVRAAMPKQMESARLAVAGAATALLLSAQPAFAGNMCAGNPTGACQLALRRVGRSAAAAAGCALARSLLSSKANSQTVSSSETRSPRTPALRSLRAGRHLHRGEEAHRCEHLRRVRRCEQCVPSRGVLKDPTPLRTAVSPLVPARAPRSRQHVAATALAPARPFCARPRTHRRAAVLRLPVPLRILTPLVPQSPSARSSSSSAARRACAW